jgi:Transposase DNA-binding
MFVLTDAAEWAEEIFGECELGDKRRSARLVRMASDLARHAGSSLLRSCDGDEAAAEGLYRLLRNAEVEPSAMAEGGFQATVRRARSGELLLAVEDSTSLSYRHSVVAELGTTSNQALGLTKGFMVHSVMLLDGTNGATVGLIEQRRWTRAAEAYGQKHQRKQRAYEDKESFKWQHAGQAVRARLGEALSGQVIAVCDREADISEYLHWQRQVGGRYVVRAAQDRTLAGAAHGLWHTLEQAPCLGSQEVEIPQRGGRPARRAQVSLRAQTVELAGSVRKGMDSLRCQALLVREEQAPAGVEALEWLLLTTEAVSTRAQALDLLWI